MEDVLFIELLTEKLNQLRIKAAMYKSNGYNTPNYIMEEMELVEKTLSRLQKNSTQTH